MRKQFTCVLASTAIVLLAGSAATAQDDRGRPPATSPDGAGDQTRDPREPRQPGGDTTTRDPKRPSDDAAARTETRDKRKDEKFVQEAAVSAAGQAELSRLAAQKALNPAVKQFAERVAAEQGKASDQLKAIAAQKNIAIPTELEGKHKKALEKLSKVSPEDFDREYMSRMLDDHKDGVSDFRKIAKAEGESEVKTFAAATLPTLEENLRLAEQFEQANRRETRGTTGTLPPDSPRPGPDPIGRPDGPGGGQPDPLGRPGSPSPGPGGQDPGGNR